MYHTNIFSFTKIIKVITTNIFYNADASHFESDWHLKVICSIFLIILSYLQEAQTQTVIFFLYADE